MDSKTSRHGVYPVPVLSFILTSFKQKHKVFIYFLQCTSSRGGECETWNRWMHKAYWSMKTAWIKGLERSHTPTHFQNKANWPHKRVISSEKIDSGLPLSASWVCVCVCVCVLHMLYNHSLREDECCSHCSILPWLSIRTDITGKPTEHNSRVLQVKIPFIFNCIYCTYFKTNVLWALRLLSDGLCLCGKQKSVWFQFHILSNEYLVNYTQSGKRDPPIMKLLLP